jgi:hypothetical protein
MVTRRGTDRSSLPSQAQEKQITELALQKKMEEERKKRHQEKLLLREEHRREEEAKKTQEDEEKRRLQEESAAQLVSPNNGNEENIEMEDCDLNKNLFDFMAGDEGDDNPRSPPKNKPKKSNKPATSDKQASATPAPAAKNTMKSALKTSFKDTHVHNFPRTLVEASIKLKSESPMQEFIIGLQELLKNGQMVDKHFAFGPVKGGNGNKNIQDASNIPSNMTLLSGHFKISSSKGKNPFEKQ